MDSRYIHRIFKRYSNACASVHCIFGTTAALGLDISALICGTIALVINSSAYIAEIFRAGINAVDKGQTEAARSLGMNYRQTMQSVVMPQAIKKILPALGNEFVTLIKESSIVSQLE